MAKPRSNCSMADIELIYRTCTVHADLKNDFGLFCAGMAAFIVTVFDKFKNEEEYATIKVDYKLMAFATIKLEETFNQVRQSLKLGKKAGKGNEMVRQKIMLIVAQAKKEAKNK